jgi:Tfp pilus assembly protein FimV
VGEVAEARVTAEVAKARAEPNMADLQAELAEARAELVVERAVMAAAPPPTLSSTLSTMTSTYSPRTRRVRMRAPSSGRCSRRSRASLGTPVNVRLWRQRRKLAAMRST